MSGILALDCGELSELVRRTPELTEWLAAAEAEDIRVVASSVTPVKARDPRTNQSLFDYAVSRVNIVPPPRPSPAMQASSSGGRGLHGHKYALDASPPPRSPRPPR